MFSSSQTVNLDAKGRMALPTRFREELATLCGGKVVVTAHQFDQCLVLYPAPEWVEVQRKLVALPEGHAKSRFMKRRVLGQAAELELDGNGRALLPQRLREFAQLEKKVLIVGQGNKFEIWPEEVWSDNDDLNGPVDEESLPDYLRELSL